MEIVNANKNDLPFIYKLFEEAIAFQKANNYIGWLNYDKIFLQKDIENLLLYKVVDNENILGIFSICLSDELIWRDKEKTDAIYIHRIVLNRQFTGEKIFKHILNWAIAFAAKKQLSFVRMDTWAANKKLIDYYKSYGFQFVEDYITADTEDLPIQHRNLNVALLQLQVSSSHNTNNHINDRIGGEYRELVKVNLYDELSTIKQYWNQKIIGVANSQLIKLAKGIGETNWHKHDDQDELFILLKGNLTIQLRNKNVELNPYDLFIVPKGIEHCPKALSDVEFLIMGLNITSTTEGGRPDWASANA